MLLSPPYSNKNEVINMEHTKEQLAIFDCIENSENHLIEMQVQEQEKQQQLLKQQIDFQTE
tara:strand:+ start:68 stop:250 length:183 start_codon:yes stop_codon:yes gene_type:complete